MLGSNLIEYVFERLNKRPNQRTYKQRKQNDVWKDMQAYTQREEEQIYTKEEKQKEGYKENTI